VQFGQVIDVTATAQQMHLFNDDADVYAKTPPPSFGLGRLLGLILVLLVWAPIGLLIYMLT
jgi:hypothetical protein